MLVIRTDLPRIIYSRRVQVPLSILTSSLVALMTLWPRVRKSIGSQISRRISSIWARQWVLSVLPAQLASQRDRLGRQPTTLPCSLKINTASFIRVSRGGISHIDYYAFHR